LPGESLLWPHRLGLGLHLLELRPLRLLVRVGLLIPAERFRLPLWPLKLPARLWLAVGLLLLKSAALWLIELAQLPDLWTEPAESAGLLAGETAAGP
jgi:hypothetical protein